MGTDTPDAEIGTAPAPTLGRVAAVRRWLRRLGAASRMFCSECGGPIVTRERYGTCSRACREAFEEDAARMW